jgi:hypothetical protein
LLLIAGLQHMASNHGLFSQDTEHGRYTTACALLARM